MSTETELRSALRSRAADAPTVDVEALLDDVARHPVPVRSTTVRPHGQQWAIAGVAAGVVAIAAVPVTVVAIDSNSGRPSGVAAADPAVSSSPTTTPRASSGAPSGTATGSPTAAMTTPGGATPTGNPYNPGAPVPADRSWVDTANDPSVDVDPSAIVFSDDPIVGFYVRAHQQLTILPAAGHAKDSSDALWHTAVQVYLPGSGFDPSTTGDLSPVTVNGVARQFGTLPKLLDVAGPAQAPSLVWPVGQAWVVLQIDTPAVPTSAQLAAAAARVDVHHG